MKVDIKPFGLRLPPDLKQWLAGMAELNRRSMNSELIMRLEQSRQAEERQPVKQ